MIYIFWRNRFYTNIVFNILKLICYLFGNIANFIKNILLEMLQLICFILYTANLIYYYKKNRYVFLINIWIIIRI